MTVILGLLLLLSLSIGVLLPMLAGGNVSISSLVRLALTVGLSWLVYQGRGWARFVLVGLLLLSTVSLLVGASLLPGVLHTVLLLMALLHLACGVSLVAVPAVNRYFEYASRQ